jgi:cell fate (sporulation/competence/biofilm development) regulator YlbF (YheA/YmcA/DUF963 family)
MKRKLFLPILGITFLISACSSTDESVVGMGGGDTAAVMPGMDKSMVTGEQMTGVTTPSVIRIADMSISTSGVQGVVSKIEDEINQLSGRIETSSYYQPTDGFNASAFISARVPEAKLDEAIAQIGKLGKQTSLNINSTDVTLQSIDLKAKIATLTESRDRLQALLDEATNVSDLIAAEDALSARQSELDSYQDQLDYLSTQVAESTLSIQIIDDSTSLTSGLRGIKATLIQTVQNFLQAFEDVVIFIGTAIPWILVLSVLYLIVKPMVRLIRRSISSRKRN